MKTEAQRHYGNLRCQQSVPITVYTHRSKNTQKRQIEKEMRQRGKEKNGWIMWRKKPNSMRISVEGIFCHKSPGDVMM